MDEIKRWIQPRPARAEGVECVGFWFTSACNLACSYCYLEKKSDATISLEMVQRILTTVLSTPGGMVELCPMGAEPLTRFPLLRQVVEWTEKGSWHRPFHFNVATNGTLLDQEKKAWFVQHRDSISLGLSIDGGVHSQWVNRGTPVPDLDFFRTTWPRQPMKITISEQTAPMVAEDIIFLHQQGVEFTANVAYEEKTWSPVSLLQYEKSLYRLAEYYASHQEIRPCNLFVPVPEKAIAEPWQTQTCYCSAGTSFEFYDMEGRSYPCHMISPMILPGEHCEAALQRSRHAEQNQDYGDPRCSHCLLRCSCFTCMGSNESYRQDLRLRDPVHCAVYRAQIRAGIHLWVKKFQRLGSLTTVQKRRLEAMGKIQAYLDAHPNGLSEESFSR